MNLRSLCLASAIFLTAHVASAQITGVTHAPKAVFAGIPVTFTVTGTGACNVSLDYGDGTPPAGGVQNKPLPPHTYVLDPAKTYPLSYPVSATGPGGPNS